MRATRTNSDLPHRSGVAAVEFAIIAPIFLALAIGMAAVHSAIRTSTQINAALAQAARLASMEAYDRLPKGMTLNEKVIADIRSLLRASGLPNDENSLVISITYAEDENGNLLSPMPSPPSTGRPFDLADPNTRQKLFRIAAEVPEGAEDSDIYKAMNLTGTSLMPLSEHPHWDVIMNNGTTTLVN